MPVNKFCKHVIVCVIHKFAVNIRRRIFSRQLKQQHHRRKDFADRLFGAIVRVFPEILQQPFSQYQRGSRGIDLLRPLVRVKLFNKVFKRNLPRGFTGCHIGYKRHGRTNPRFQRHRGVLFRRINRLRRKGNRLCAKFVKRLKLKRNRTFTIFINL